MKNEIDAKELFVTPSGKDSSGLFESLPDDMPTEEEFQEAVSPNLSMDEFTIAEKTFKIKMSNIITQKIMAKSLNVITDLIKKIDLKPIFEFLQDKINKDRNKLINRIGELEKNKDSGKIDFENVVKQMAEEDETSYLDMVELIQQVIIHGGISNIIETILDLYAGVVYAICKSQDDSITKEWIENNLTFIDAQDIFFQQMEKDRIGGKVIDFLYVLTRQVIKEET